MPFLWPLRLGAPPRDECASDLLLEVRQIALFFMLCGEEGGTFPYLRKTATDTKGSSTIHVSVHKKKVFVKLVRHSTTLTSTCGWCAEDRLV
jgi:hypothetical protein